MDAAREDRSFPLLIESDDHEEDKLVVNKNHQYYFQCQLNMYLIEKKLFYFVIYTLKELFFIIKEIDPRFLTLYLPKPFGFGNNMRYLRYSSVS